MILEALSFRTNLPKLKRTAEDAVLNNGSIPNLQESSNPNLPFFWDEIELEYITIFIIIFSHAKSDTVNKQQVKGYGTIY